MSYKPRFLGLYCKLRILFPQLFMARELRAWAIKLGPQLTKRPSNSVSKRYVLDIFEFSIENILFCEEITTVPKQEDVQ